MYIRALVIELDCLGFESRLYHLLWGLGKLLKMCLKI